MTQIQPYQFYGNTTRPYVPGYKPVLVPTRRPRSSSDMSIRTRRSTRSGSSSSSSKRYTSRIVTTNQHDFAQQYRYRRMPRYKKRRWIRALKLNRALDMSEAATQTAIYSSAFTLEMNLLTQSQKWGAVHLYGLMGVAKSPTLEVGVEDIKAIRNENARLNVLETQRILFESGVIDITIRNPNATNGLEVDVYDVTYRNETKFDSLQSVLEECDDKTPSSRSPPNVSDEAVLTKRGVTPFDIVLFGSFGCKVLNKRKVFLPPGQTFTYQYRDPRNRYFGPDDFDDNNGFVKPWITRTVLFVYKTVVGQEVLTNPKLDIGVTRTYKYKIKGNTDPTIIYG